MGERGVPPHPPLGGYLAKMALLRKTEHDRDLTLELTPEPPPEGCGGVPPLYIIVSQKTHQKVSSFSKGSLLVQSQISVDYPKFYRKESVTTF